MTVEIDNNGEDLMRYDILLFDADDTLFDFQRAQQYALQKVYSAFDMLDKADEYTACYKEIGKEIWGELERGEITLAELRVERFKRLFNKYQLPHQPEAFGDAYLKFLGEGSFLVEGAEELCQALSTQRLAIITNGFREVQIPRISHSPLSQMFEQIIISEDTGYQKPQKEIFEYAFDKLGITRKDRVLMIGDSLTSDILGGNRYGIDTCWFNPKQKKNETDISPTYEIAKLTDLLRIVAE